MPIHVPPFPFPPNPPSWYAGHMAVFINDLPKILSTTSIVLEARDARLPLTSVNPAFETALQRYWANAHLEGKERIVVYTKRDLAERRYEEPLKRAFEKYTGQKLMFVDTSKPGDIRRILAAVTEVAKEHEDVHRRGELLVVGMPNVGKSTLLNALRNSGVHKGKAFRTSTTAGLTRKFTSHVKILEKPEIYVSDTPGVMVPYLGRGTAGSEKGMKLAVTSGIKENLYDAELLAAYLIHILPLKTKMPFDLPHPYADFFSATETSFSSPISVERPHFLATLAERLGRLKKGGIPDTASTAVWLIDWFRKGGAGRWTSDFEDVGGVKGVDEGVKMWVEAGMGVIGDEGGSQNQEKKKRMAERLQKRVERWKRLHGDRAGTTS
ncbi:P-loop containing nucleoside triphosphate hydrolase protein [Calocera viscosa TUFC12733]|uniref:p-loop containing nucleoside triphosphate hydrolase protein n=1 Tax=Calocera viscosa (strain TUFC12733) TaxID=1330018 RepID=A0A167HYY6_CALVF|nr:P-loop containing nucleoside triphosphate hydrolase protein [Calocera viscosa TUFC12733]